MNVWRTDSLTAATGSSRTHAEASDGQVRASVGRRRTRRSHPDSRFTPRVNPNASSSLAT